MQRNCYRHEHVLRQLVLADNPQEPNFCNACAGLSWFKVTGKFPLAEFYTWTFYKAKDAAEVREFAKQSGWRDVRVEEITKATKQPLIANAAQGLV